MTKRTKMMKVSKRFHSTVSRLKDTYDVPMIEVADVVISNANLGELDDLLTNKKPRKRR